MRKVGDWRIANADVMAEAVLDGPWQDISHVLEDEGDVTLDELDSICPHSDGDSDTSKLIIKVVGFCFIPLAARLTAAVAWAVARRCFRRGRLDDSLQGESEPPPSSDAEGTSEDSQGPTVAQSATAPEDTENGGDGGGNGGDRPDGDANGDEGNGDGSGDGDAQGDGGGVNDNHENNGDNGNHGEANADTNVDYKNNSDNGATDDHEEGGIPETLPQLAGGSREETNDRVRLATERAEVQPPDGA